MGIRVLKFGGSCLKDGDSLRKTVEVIKNAGKDIVVVVSAVSGVTDALIKAIDEALESENTVLGNIRSIISMHEKVLSGFPEYLRKSIIDKIVEKFSELKRYLYGVAYTQELTRPVKAAILSFGERFSALLLSAVLENEGVKSKACEADDLGLVTDENYENATALIDVASRNLKESLLPLIDSGTVPVVTGYFGVTRGGRVTTFGRNGSDYTAAIVAVALDAEKIELWKDVDGFMSADPKIVSDVEKLDRLSYYEAAELSYFGARIIHPRTFEPLLSKGIPVSIRSILDPSFPGTTITPQGYIHERVIKSITYNRSIGVLRVHGPGVGYKPGVIAQIGQALSSSGINIYSILTSQTSINLLLDKKDIRRAMEVLSPLKEGTITALTPEEDIALVGVVGEGLMKRKGIFGQMFSRVAKKGVNVEMVSAGASEVAYYFIVKEKDLDATVQAIHDWMIDR